MPEIRKILEEFENSVKEENQHIHVSFEEYLSILRNKPHTLLRDIFQLVHDMVHYYVPEGTDEYPDDPESVHYVKYDFQRLFVKGSDNPFFADRLFGNRFMELIDSFNQVPDWHKIYFFEGPPGSGKSTFLKNFLYRFERYMRTAEGEFYETVWKIDRTRFIPGPSYILKTGADLNNLLLPESAKDSNTAPLEITLDNRYIMVPCPNHDPPILQIPKTQRKQLLYDLIADKQFKEMLFNDKKYKWIFKGEPCTICSSLYEALVDKFNSPMDVLNMLYPRRMRFNRRLGEGISVFNPGDLFKNKVHTNPALQNTLDNIFGDSDKVKYMHSHLAKTNNGIFVVMDVKNQNKERLLNLHGVVSDGIHKVEHIEENIKSLFIALINPQDKDLIEKTKSLKDRTIYIKMPYVLDYKTEVQIFKNNFGVKISERFLPQVLDNFAKVIIASRLNKESEGLDEWIGNPRKYSKYCDPDLLILKMDVYTGIIPDWIQEEDRRKFKAKIRRKILNEGESEGFRGFTGRESIFIFNEFFSLFSKKDQLITMQMVYDFFTKNRPAFEENVSVEFLESLVRSYDYTILQQVKECLYSYNKATISNNIYDYIFAVNFDPGGVEKNRYTGHVLEITETFFKNIEDYIIGKDAGDRERREFRNDILQKYVSQTAMELAGNKKRMNHTELYRELYDKYVRNLKNNALDPFLDNENFRNAIKEYNTKEFRSYDKKIKRDVTFLIRKLMRRYDYTETGAKEMCIYVIDKNLAQEFKTE